MEAERSLRLGVGLRDSRGRWRDLDAVTAIVLFPEPAYPQRAAEAPSAVPFPSAYPAQGCPRDQCRCRPPGLGAQRRSLPTESNPAAARHHRGRALGGSNVAFAGAFCHNVGPPGITAGWLKKPLHPVRARVASSSAMRIKLDLQMLGAAVLSARSRYGCDAVRGLGEHWRPRWREISYLG